MKDQETNKIIFFIFLFSLIFLNNFLNIFPNTNPYMPENNINKIIRAEKPLENISEISTNNAPNRPIKQLTAAPNNKAAMETIEYAKTSPEKHCPIVPSIFRNFMNIKNIMAPAITIKQWYCVLVMVGSFDKY
jgi:hypothetical protein